MILPFYSHVSRTVGFSPTGTEARGVIVGGSDPVRGWVRGGAGRVCEDADCDVGVE